MKIFVITEFSLNEDAGHVVHVTEVMNILKRRGHDIYIFTPKSKDRPVEYAFKLIEIPVIHFTVFRLLSYQFFLFFYLIYFCFKKKPDLLYNRLELFSVSPSLISRICSVKHLIEINGLKVDELILSNKSPLLIWLVQGCYRYTILHSDLIITITHGIKNEILKNYAVGSKKVHVVHNGVNVELFQPDLRKKDPSEYFVGFIGNLTPIQGIETIIETIPKVAAVQSNIHFIIGGEGSCEYQNTLKNHANKYNVSDKISFLGAIPYKNAYKSINSFDVCLAPYIKFRNDKIGISPLKIFSYLSCGKPVIASRIKGLGFIEKNDLGFLVDPGSADVLADAILKLIRNSKLRFDMGKRARKFVEENYSWDIVTDKIEHIICQ